jgi:hypothetical protein
MLSKSSASGFMVIAPRLVCFDIINKGKTGKPGLTGTLPLIVDGDAVGCDLGTHTLSFLFLFLRMIGLRP